MLHVIFANEHNVIITVKAKIADENKVPIVGDNDILRMFELHRRRIAMILHVDTKRNIYEVSCNSTSIRQN